MLTVGETKIFTHNPDMSVNNVKIDPGLYGFILVGANNYQRYNIRLSFPATKNINDGYSRPETLLFYVGDKYGWNNGESDIRIADGHWNSMASKNTIITSSKLGISNILQEKAFIEVTCLEIYHPYTLTDTKSDDIFKTLKPIIPFKNEFLNFNTYNENVSIDTYFHKG